MKIRKEDALKYHSRLPKGKIGVQSSKPVSTQRDLSLAYSPGVAYPCLEIAENKEAVYQYTIKGNLVAVLTNGTAVLGLGNIGPEAAKPVMEGKGVLFKKFAGIDVFDIEINATTVEEFVMVAKALEPGPLKKFYQSITRSEQRHYQLFLDLAAVYLPAATVANRWQELLEVEADIVARLPLRAALH